MNDKQRRMRAVRAMQARIDSGEIVPPDVRDWARIRVIARDRQLLTGESNNASFAMVVDALAEGASYDQIEAELIAVAHEIEDVLEGVVVEGDE